MHHHGSATLAFIADTRAVEMMLIQVAEPFAL
jgi:hypothetical protein